MIWLPGILSQGGKKYVWKRYGLVYTETAGVSKSVTLTPTITKKAASTYTRSGSTFTLTNPTSTAASNITSGKFLVSVDTKNNSSVSSKTLYKVTGNSKQDSYKAQSGSTTNKTFTASYLAAEWGWPTSYTTKADGIYLSNTEYFPFTDLKSSDTIYCSTFSSGYGIPGGVSTTTAYATIYKCTGFNPDSVNLSCSFTATAINHVATSYQILSYTPYTAPASKGEYIDDVKANPGTYPENGIQDGYWYILQE